MRTATFARNGWYVKTRSYSLTPATTARHNFLARFRNSPLSWLVVPRPLRADTRGLRRRAGLRLGRTRGRPVPARSGRPAALSLGGCLGPVAALLGEELWHRFEEFG